MEVRPHASAVGFKLLERLMSVRVFYDVIDPNTIFGMVGRCGGGYNTVWEDWSPRGRIAREKIMREYEEGLNKICGHYDKLEKSVLKEGFRNPLIITCGEPKRCKIFNLPPEITRLPKERWLLLEGVTGGSRLWVAQKYNIIVPCIINDFTGKYNTGTLMTDVNQLVSRYFVDAPKSFKIDAKRGFTESYDNSQKAYHMESWWSEKNIVKQRAPMWVSIMNKHGYYVDRLQPFVHEILREAGVIQPTNLKKVFPTTKFYVKNPSI